MRCGLQLFSVRNALRRDPERTLRAVAEIGYRHIESCTDESGGTGASGLGLPVRAARPLIRELGLAVVGSHFLFFNFRGEETKLEAYLEAQAELGCGSPGVAAIFPETRDEALRECDRLNRVGERCRARGMKLHYHNHFHEFVLFGEETLFDIILRNTDPALVDIELDAYWTVRGGADPIELISGNRERISLLHIKDLPRATRRVNLFDGYLDRRVPVELGVYSSGIPPQDFIEAGAGMLDIPAIAGAAEAADVRCILVDQDHSAMEELRSVAESYRCLRKLSSIDWS